MRTATVGVAAAATGATAVAVTLPWSDIFKGILGAGGVPPALFLLVVLGLVTGLLMALNALKKEQDARDQERVSAADAAMAIQEKRILEGREMLLALERTATALTTNTVAMEARTPVLNELVKGMDGLSRSQETTHKHFDLAVGRLEAGVTEALKLLRGV